MVEGILDAIISELISFGIVEDVSESVIVHIEFWTS
jgi:hypothetical protein